MRFRITEARARFCFHPGVTHTLMSERRAAEMMAERAFGEGHRPVLPKNRDEMGGKEILLDREAALALLDQGFGVDDVARRLGCSPETLRDRLRLWRPRRQAVRA